MSKSDNDNGRNREGVPIRLYPLQGLTIKKIPKLNEADCEERVTQTGESADLVG